MTPREKTVNRTAHVFSTPGVPACGKAVNYVDLDTRAWGEIDGEVQTVTSRAESSSSFDQIVPVEWVGCG